MRFRFPQLLLPLLLLSILTAAGCSQDNKGNDPDMNNIYTELDEQLALVPQYDQQKEQRIATLKQTLQRARDEVSKFSITNNIIAEYESYSSDSALNYVDQNLVRARHLGGRQKLQQLQLKRVDIMSHAGLFGDAAIEMHKIDRNALDSTLLESYYYIYCGLYQYMGEYNNDTEYTEQFEKQRQLYTDSIMMIAPVNSFWRISYETNSMIIAGQYDEAQARLLEELGHYKQGTREYAILASTLAYAYKSEGEINNYKKYLALSAISDIKSSTKENMSFRELSSTLFNDGDLTRAKHYLQKSFDDANFYSARMRTAQSARMLPVIDTAYEARQTQLQSRLKWLLILVGMLALILAVSIYFILKTMRRIHQANITIREHNEELSSVEKQLRRVNGELADTNAALKQSDSIKEEYAGLFMVFSSLTISNLERYQQVLHNLAIKGNVKELLKKIDSSNVADQTLKDFYNRFDEAILNIYPNFVEKVNSLMRPNEQIIPKPGCKLNTELRVLALLRIGITDSEKIAEFLRCSLTTVYTYRSKIRKRAINPDTFEQDIHH